MDKTALETYRDNGIELFWLVKTDHSAYTRIAEAYRGDGTYIVCRGSGTGIGSIGAYGRMDTRRLVYPAPYTAGRLEAQGRNVRFHATTRSPIAVSTEEDYPLHTRYELCSLYDSRRITYIYDLRKYDMVVIITDAAGKMTEGICSLVHALRLCGNEQIVLAQCKETS